MNILLLIEIVIFIKIVTCDNYFSVTAPAVLRINEPYKIAITTHQVEKHVEKYLSVGIYGFNNEGQFIEDYKKINLNSSESIVTKLNVRN